MKTQKDDEDNKISFYMMGSGKSILIPNTIIKDIIKFSLVDVLLKYKPKSVFIEKSMMGDYKELIE